MVSLLLRALIAGLVLVMIANTSAATHENEGSKSMKFGMQVVMTAHAGKGDELGVIMLRASALVADMPGCEIYIVQQSINDDSKILITEVWTNKEAHQASLLNSQVRELIMQAKPLIADMQHHAALPLGGKS